MHRTANTATCPTRCVHLIDIENLLGGYLTCQRAEHLISAYCSTGLVGSRDLVVIAGARRGARHWLFAPPSGWRRIITSDAPEAADLALIDAVSHISFSATTHLAIASGDHRFLPLAARARSGGALVFQLIGEGKPALAYASRCDHTVDLRTWRKSGRLAQQRTENA
jgi:hypothetical protein